MTVNEIGPVKYNREFLPSDDCCTFRGVETVDIKAYYRRVIDVLQALQLGYQNSYDNW